MCLDLRPQVRDAPSRNQLSPSSLTATCVCDRARPRNVPARNAEQFAHAQFHCGKPPPAADPRIFTSTPRFYRAELICVATAASAVESRCEKGAN